MKKIFKEYLLNLSENSKNLRHVSHKLLPHIPNLQFKMLEDLHCIDVIQRTGLPLPSTPASTIGPHCEGQASRISRSFQICVPEEKCQVNEAESMRASFLQATPNHRAEGLTQVWMDENTGSPVTFTSVNSQINGYWQGEICQQHQRHYLNTALWSGSTIFIPREARHQPCSKSCPIAHKFSTWEEKSTR